MSDIELLNSMLYQSLKQEIENLRDSAIFIPSVVIIYEIKIDKDIADVKVKNIEPQFEFKMLIEYIAESLAGKLKEEIEKSLKEDYHKIIKEQIYIPPHLEMMHQFDAVVIDRKGVMIGGIKGVLSSPKDTQKQKMPMPKIILKAMKSYIISIPSTIQESLRKLFR
jgi:hypothetical protein